MISVGSEVQILPGPLPVAGNQSSVVRVFFCELTTEPDDCYGGVAQLGEHLLCKQGVTGSIPVVSRNSRRLSVFRCQRARSENRRLIICSKYRGMSRIRCDHVAQAKRPGLWIMPFKRLPQLDRWGGRVCSLECKSGSGASLGACDENLSAGTDGRPAVQPTCLTGRVVRKDSAPTVGQRGFRGAVNNLTGRIFCRSRKRKMVGRLGRIGVRGKHDISRNPFFIP